MRRRVNLIDCAYGILCEFYAPHLAHPCFIRQKLALQAAQSKTRFPYGEF